LSTNIITTEGHEALKKELDHLWRVYRPEITQKVTWAASLGDRSENADYQYNKKLLREIDRRVRYLRKRLEDVKVVAYSPEQEGKVFFGAWVEIENDEGETKKFRIVGYDEIYGRNDSKRRRATRWWCRPRPATRPGTSTASATCRNGPRGITRSVWERPCAAMGRRAAPAFLSEQHYAPVAVFSPLPQHRQRAGIERPPRAEHPSTPHQHCPRQG
jgi:transcription elongation factor GreB